MRAIAPIVLAALASLVAGCPRTLSDYYPLEAGRSWTYRMNVRQGDEGGGRLIEATSVVANLPERDFAGEKVVPQRQDAFGAVRIRLIRDDGESVAEVGEASGADGTIVPRGQVNRIIRRPLTPGASWSATWETMQSGAPTLLPMRKTVAATDGVIELALGRFGGCLGLAIAGGGPVVIGDTEQEVLVTGEEWFAPGVGLVRASFRETMPGRPEATMHVDLALIERRP